MQKVEGSSPFIRSSEPAGNSGFSLDPNLVTSAAAANADPAPADWSRHSVRLRRQK